MQTIKNSLLAVFLMIMLAACSKATQGNYDKIENDMQREQVHKILGAPDEVNSSSLGSLSFSSETWKGRDHTISIQYANGRVKMKHISANETKENQ